VNYYSHHLGDYTKDTAHLSMIEDGAYRRLIDLYYSTEAPLIADRAKLYRLVRAFTKQDREAVDTVLAEFFELTDEGYRQSRCDTELSKMHEKSNKARASVEKRWQNERNTNVPTNVLPTQYEGNTPNNQEPITNNQEEPKPKAPAVPFAPPDWVPDEAWKGWLAMRKAKRTPNSAHALGLAVKTLDGLRESGFDPKDVLDQSTVRGWTGLFEVKTHADAKSMKPRFAPERDFKTIDYRAGVKPDGRF
jgi:uncharacterized protein YdaU (DUF1376 family)